MTVRCRESAGGSSPPHLRILKIFVKAATFLLPFERTGVMNRHAPTRRRKRIRRRIDMTNAETNDTAAAVAEQGAHVAPEKTPTKKGASQKKGAPKGKKAAKGGKAKGTPKKEAKANKKAAKPATAKEASTPRPKSTGAKILDLIGRAKGATLAEIMKATDWQAHSVRGFLSTAAKKHGLKIESTKTEAGDRVYRTK